MYLVCLLDGDHFSSAEFEFCHTLDKAKEYTEHRAKEYLDGFEITETKWDSDTRYDVTYFNDRNGYYYGFNEFLVMEIIEVTKRYPVIRYHGYNGVDFELVGESDSLDEAKSLLQKQEDEEFKGIVYEYYPSKTDFEIDTGEEWIRCCILDTERK